MVFQRGRVGLLKSLGGDAAGSTLSSTVPGV